MEAIQEKIDELNKALAGTLPYEICFVDPFGVELLEDNARYMRNDMFAQLVANVKRDKGLASVPLLYHGPGGGKPKVLSGNHRFLAAQVAKLPGVLCLAIREAKTLDEQVAIQLSHNAIVGADDLPKLKALYESISQLDLKAYSGLDEDTIQKLNSIKFEAVTQPNLAFRTVTFLFLTAEVDEIAAMVKQTEKLLESRDSFLFQLRDYQAFFEMIAGVKEKLDIKNSAAAILELMRAGHRQIEREEMEKMKLDPANVTSPLPEPAAVPPVDKLWEQLTELDKTRPEGLTLDAAIVVAQALVEEHTEDSAHPVVRARTLDAEA